MQDATLLYLIDNKKILLGLKKRGYGLGKWNGVGGKIKHNESILSAVIRECEEEIRVTPRNPQLIGTLYIDRTPYISKPMQVYVFVAVSWNGTPTESDEMIPNWFYKDAIPYNDMWPTDRLWMPHLLKGESFSASIQ